MKEVWFDTFLGIFFTAVAVWVLSLVFRYSMPRHDVVASLVGFAYAGCFLLGTGIMVNRIIQLLRR